MNKPTLCPQNSAKKISAVMDILCPLCIDAYILLYIYSHRKEKTQIFVEYLKKKILKKIKRLNRLYSHIITKKILCRRPLALITACILAGIVFYVQYFTTVSVVIDFQIDSRCSQRLLLIKLVCNLSLNPLNPKFVQ